MPSLSATETAHGVVACQQLLVALGWWIGARLIPATRAPALEWSAAALLGGLASALLLAGSRLDGDAIRLAAVLAGTAAVIALQRGVWRFFGQPVRWRLHVLALLAAASIAALGLDAGHRAARIALNSALVSVLHLWLAIDLVRLAGAESRRFGLGVAAPMLVGALVFAMRCLRALSTPDDVSEITEDTWRNFVAVLIYMALSLALQLTLLSLLFGRLLHELRGMLRRDALTGLLNRRALDEALDDEAHRAQRLRAPFALLMIDADHFKQVNDRFGHAAGDGALQHLATLIAPQMRDIDRLARYGGEEFVALLPGCTLAEAELAAERVRERVASVPLIWQQQALTLSVSIGVAAWRGDADGPQSLLSRADEALYAAKRGGRNCWQSAA
jgi:diguanylate cyclase (GGDEF)-like protein